MKSAYGVLRIYDEHRENDFFQFFLGKMTTFFLS